MTKNSTFTKGQGRQTKQDQEQLLHLPWALLFWLPQKVMTQVAWLDWDLPPESSAPASRDAVTPRARPPQEFPRNRPLVTERRCHGNPSLNNFGISTTFD